MASTVELTLRYTTVDVHCRDRTEECDRGIINYAFTVIIYHTILQTDNVCKIFFAS